MSLLAIAIMCCQHPSSTPSPSNASDGQPRLQHPEQLITLPEGSEWPRQIDNGQFPQYPRDPRRDGVEAFVLAAFVVNADGRPEPRTISILQSPAGFPEFASSVCTFLRTGAWFTWGEHAPARALVVTPFFFHLTGVIVTQSSPRAPDLGVVRDSLREMSPPQLAAWIESKPHCL
jgi:hypothetical protein